MSRSITVEQIARIAKPIVLRRHVAELYMFGSMLRGEVYVNWDIDFTYQLGSEANPVVDTLTLRDDLKKTFGYDIDLVRKKYIAEPLSDRLAEI